MTSLLGVLYGYSGRVVERLSFGITLNGLVAVLATISRTALMVPVASGLSQGKWIWFSPRRALPNGERLQDLETFDSASRGAWGSLQLLWRLKARHMASFGALITILTLAFDVFAQQVVSTSDQSTLVPNSGLQFPLDVPRSENYTISTNANNESDRIPDWLTYAAIYNGILASNMSYLPVPCTTGKCTWPVIPSLGICGDCKPLTWTTVGNCGPQANSSIYGPDAACNYTLPDGQSISVNKQSLSVNMFQVMATVGTSFNASSATIAYVLNFEAIGMPYGTKLWNESLISAQECALWYCVQAYNISVTNNVLNQTIVDTWGTISPRSFTDITGNENYTFTNIPSEMNVHPNSTYFVAFLAVVAGARALSSIFEGATLGGAEGIEYSTPFIEAIWVGWDDMEGLVSRLARSMTNNIRNTSPAAPYVIYTGMAYRDVVLVYVRWGWLVFPISLVLFSLIFLVSSMRQTHTAGVSAWKSSALALLFSDVDHSVKAAAHHSVEKRDGLVKITGGSQVILRETNGFLAFTNSKPTC